MTEKLMARILPPNATAYERALAKQVDEILSLDVQKIRYLWNPWKCDIELLPYLAWALSVDIWEPGWSEEKKRLVVANAIKHHKLKGTQAGIEAYLDIVGCTANKFIVPPARGFRMPAMSNAQWLAYLSEAPQIRIYPFSYPKVDETTGFRMRQYEFRNLGFREHSQGPLLYGRRATIFKDGVEADVRIDQINGFGGIAAERVYIGGIDNRDFRSKGFRKNEFRETTRAMDNVVTISISQNASQFLSLTAGLEPQQVQPTRIAQRHTPPAGQHFHGYNKSFRGVNFRRATDAPLFIYDRMVLHGADTLPKPLQARWYRGDERYGIPSYTAQINVSIPMERSRARGFGGRFRNGFRLPTDMSRLDDACNAIVVAKSLRDTVYIDTVTHRVIQLKDKPKLGSFRLGQIVRVA